MVSKSSYTVYQLVTIISSLNKCTITKFSLREQIQRREISHK